MGFLKDFVTKRAAAVNGADANDPAKNSPATPAWRAAVGGVLVAVALIASAALAISQHRFGGGNVTIGDNIRLTADIAATDATREKGLSGRDGLAPDHGMLFLFEAPGRYAFWMKDMRFPIDILWIRDGQLVDITTDAAVPVPGLPLPQYRPIVPVDSVLEVQAGFAKAHGLRIGLPIKADVDRK